MKDLGVGIVGCGVISTIYMQNVASFRGVRLVACADILEQTARTQADKFGIRALSIEALMRDPEVDVVVNLTTPNVHFEVSHAALTAGKHVFSEKPLCVTAEDGHRLVQEANRRGLAFGCAPDTFLGAGGRLAREIVDGGKVGSVLAGTCSLMSRGMEHWHPNPGFFFQPGGGPELLRRHGRSHRTWRRLAIAGFLDPALRQAELAIAGLARQRAGSGELSLPRDRGTRQRHFAWNAASVVRRLRRACAGSH